MKTRPQFGKQILGVRICESYRCHVPGCGIDCGDSGTLARHLNRAHPELAASGQRVNPSALSRQEEHELAVEGEDNT